jgi:hypothetical protein
VAYGRAEIILDSEFAGDLERLAAAHPVWIVESPSNIPAIQRAWKSGLPPAALTKCNGELLGIIPEVILHHGVRELTIRGVALSPVVLRTLSEQGFRVTAESGRSFVATPVPGAVERVSGWADTAAAEYVAVVLDERFSDFLTPLAEAQPVWVVDTPANRAAAGKTGAIVFGPQLQTVTVFDCADPGDPARCFAAVLPRLREYRGVNVFGVMANEIEAELVEHGFGPAVAALDGFLAGRSKQLGYNRSTV